MSDPSSVKVAVRVRPLVPTEIEKGCKEIIESIEENNQVWIKNCDKAFTFNYVMGPTAPDDVLYSKCVRPLIKQIYEGFNVTIFAYGQTGSGKTYSMGTAYNGEGHMGVIPLAVAEIFDYVRDQFNVDFSITVSFIELYREVLYDLLSNKPRDQSVLDIREDLVKGTYIPNLTEIPVSSAQEVLNILAKGSQGRAVASTNMNQQSSRSHSIFTVSLDMQHKTDKNQSKTAKLHLVDLAGSERPKKTGAQGTTFKEGVDINKGLFVLGNVISALGDEKQQNGFIPYRDSNLTRLLKDSLGGNSLTLMVACVSPADYNLDETVSTLRYADRARKIKNKPIINQDPKAAEINALKRQVKQLQLQIVGQGGPIISTEEIDKLRSENTDLHLKIKSLMVQLSAALLEKTGLHETLLILQSANEALSKKLAELKDECNATFSRLSMGVEQNDVQTIKDNLGKLQEIQKHFEVLHEDQIKTENEIRKNEETFTILAHMTGNSSNGSASSEIQQGAESHTTKQMALNSQLQEVSKQLMQKEQLARQLANNTCIMVDEYAMAETQKKIDNLEKEKDELLQQLRNVKTKENSSKVSEQRRKRVQELEEQLKELKRKVMEQSRLIKLKEKDEQKIKLLNQEIVSMKSKKVGLVKQMREETERFRTWKQQTERELARVRQQERKKENEMAKMKVTHEKQKNVLKRKFEEAAALNKRLQGTLMKRRQAQEIRFTGKIEKIAGWLKEELDVHVNIVEATASLEGLLEDRATLQQQLDALRQDPETSNGPEAKSIEEDIELRSIQIQDLQQKLLDSDEDNKSKTRFDVIQSMVEAKFALKSLFELSVECHKEKVQARRELTEMQESQKGFNKKLEEMSKEMHHLEDHFAEKMADQEKRHQETVGLLLMQLRGIENKNVAPESELMHRLQIQNEQIHYQQSLLEETQEENQKLKVKLEEIKKAAKSAQLLQKKGKIKEENTSEEQNSDEMISQEANDNCKTPEKRQAAVNGDDQFKTPDILNDTVDVFDFDDPKRDPDWRRTPLGKRVIDTKPLLKATLLNNIDPDQSKPGPSKRSSEGGCACKLTCTRRCGCRRTSKKCSKYCKCSESCTYRENSENNENESAIGNFNRDSEGSTGNSTFETAANSSAEDKSFKRPRPTPYYRTKRILEAKRRTPNTSIDQSPNTLIDAEIQRTKRRPKRIFASEGETD
ncbi:chromosome-associated kinesin KIF4-like [Anthonomus grandis grandis]|uniref:chromosome-associated kinesin KIF4-like n=1 Tax=Anthonomus grandis grandis TaxID=2921223 RepID=UPI002166BD28|nr:chromosome-associated kinesin KIF4-like [Anthonomus grandis grandis]